MSERQGKKSLKSEKRISILVLNNLDIMRSIVLEDLTRFRLKLSFCPAFSSLFT